MVSVLLRTVAASLPVFMRMRWISGEPPVLGVPAGDPSEIAMATTPVVVDELSASNIVRIACGWDTSLALSGTMLLHRVQCAETA